MVQISNNINFIFIYFHIFSNYTHTFIVITLKVFLIRNMQIKAKMSPVTVTRPTHHAQSSKMRGKKGVGVMGLLAYLDR